MNQTPNANRKHISLYGNTNAGKSSFLNAVVGQRVSLVSDIHGTTTDPVSKTMELLPYGPVVFVDTAGLQDHSSLGSLREARTYSILRRTDLALYIMDATQPSNQDYAQMVDQFKRYNIPHMLVINKVDLIDPKTRIELHSEYQHAHFVSAHSQENILHFKDALIAKLAIEQDPPLIGDLLPQGAHVILVIPVDSEAPKGRLILPQVQVMRDLLDHGMKATLVRDSELESALHAIDHVDLVITDSQAFHTVNQIVPSTIPLTGFSTIFARHKGDLNTFVTGLQAIDALNASSRVLIAESCSHNHSHEDIGRVKIPRLLNKHTGLDLHYEFYMGHDFPQDLAQYDLVIHCGSCMLNAKTMNSRLLECVERNVPITNYGILLAYLNGILPRSLEIFKPIL
ncbi:MAG: [FeFe] hydrogenase H-cluster maturation GTPase HydF [Erysipelotrichaceae bacterium]